MTPTANEKEEKRAAIESEFNAKREELGKKYIEDVRALEYNHHNNILANQKAKREAFLEAGLNSDGSEPYGRPQG